MNFEDISKTYLGKAPLRVAKDTSTTPPANAAVEDAGVGSLVTLRYRIPGIKASGYGVTARVVEVSVQKGKIPAKNKWAGEKAEKFEETRYKIDIGGETGWVYKDDVTE